ncbi:WD repeat-containing protein WRAP73-like [Bolinopsis microptera]|uniref:WD repeat-containing protein WRAP73-like n=1 Tax=Bolinopsis microptera TaxID=2820187 RepID=UPI00307935D0
MNFSKRFKNSVTPAFSECGKMVANANGSKVLVRDVNTLQLLQMWVCYDTVRDIVWSPDSNYLASVSGNKIQLWSMSDSAWRSCISETNGGVDSVTWSPDSRHLLVLHQFSVFITIWAVEFATQMFVKNPKGSLYRFSGDGKYLAVIERMECNDYVAVLSTRTWKLTSHFKLPTIDAAGFEWSPSNLELCIWDHMFDHRLYIYSLDGSCLFTHEVKKPISMGLQCVAWSPCGQYIALGTHTHYLYLINRTNRKVAGEMLIPESVSGRAVQFYREVHSAMSGNSVMERLQSPPEHKFQVVTDDHIDMKFAEIVIKKKTSTKTNDTAKEKRVKKYGITAIKWSHDSSHLAVLDASNPNTITVWSIADKSITAVLQFVHNPRTFAWHPHLLRLIVASGDSSVSMWEYDGCWIIELPAECSVNVNHTNWSSDGNALLLSAKDNFCIGFLE